MKAHKYVDLDVHSVSTVIAVADGGRSGEVRLYGKVSSDLHALEKVLRGARGTHRVRYFGRLHPAAKARRAIVETLLAVIIVVRAKPPARPPKARVIPGLVQSESCFTATVKQNA